MGSLMAGWDSPVSDPKAVKFQRNRSLTKEEIATYWRSKKKKEEENVKASSNFSYLDQENTWEGSEKRYKRSNSLPLGTKEKENLMMDMHEEESTEKQFKKHGWWISSNWAFLNEPPVISGPTHKYASQFHVAHMNNSNSHATTKELVLN